MHDETSDVQEPLAALQGQLGALEGQVSTLQDQLGAFQTQNSNNNSDEGERPYGGTGP